MTTTRDAPTQNVPTPANAPAGIDQRMRERRVAVLREQGRRRLRVLLVAVSVGSVLGIAWLVVQSPLLALERLEVRGAVRVSPQEVRRAAEVGNGDALLFVDAGEAARGVEALPWVASARVRRELPHKLVITVVERVPAAWVRRAAPGVAGTGAAVEPVPVAVVDARGRVVADAATAPEGLPELVGVTAVPTPGRRIAPAFLARVPGALPEPLRAQVASVSTDGAQVVLTLRTAAGGAPPAGEVRLGAPSALVRKGAAALAVLDALLARGERVQYVDVRVPGAPATG